MTEFEVRYLFRSNPSDSVFTIPYKLFDTKMSLKWVEALRQQKTRDYPFYTNSFYGSAFYNEKEIRDAIQRSIDGVNSFKNRPWIDYKTYPDMDHKFLMTLHDEFERYDRLRILRELGAPEDVLDSLSDLNVYIHRYENLFGPRESFHISAIFNEVWRYEFEEEDYRLFTPDSEDGILYLDYGVTGVPVLHAYRSQAENHPVSQNNFTSGSTIYFGGQCVFDEHEKVKEWFKGKYPDSKMDPMKGFGYIPLGQCTLEKPKTEILDEILNHPILSDVKIINTSSNMEIDYGREITPIRKFQYS